MTSKQRMRFLQTISNIIVGLIEDEENGDECVLYMDIVKVKGPVKFMKYKSSHIEYIYDRNKLNMSFTLTHKRIPGHFKEERDHNV